MRRTNYRRAQHREQRLVVLVLAFLLVLGVVGWALSMRPRARQAAAHTLPTARLALPASGSIAGMGGALPSPPAPAPTQPAPTQLAQAPGDAPPPTAAPPLPTPTITPQALPLVDGSLGQHPVPTLFPTVAPAPAGASVPVAAPVGGPPPILMYHYVRTVDQASDPLGYELSVTPDQFAAQMDWLHAQQYTTMRMDAAARCIRGEAACPAHALVLTFDDGYADAYTDALPILQRYGFTATFYIVSSFVGQPGYMSWEQLAALRDSGMEIGSHTISHSDLTSLDSATASYEIGQSKAELEQRLNLSVVSFCYPTGLYNWSIEDLVRAAGYTNATTTRWDGDYSDVMALPRRRISGETWLDSFVAVVQG